MNESRRETKKKLHKFVRQKRIQKSKDADCDKPYWVSLFFDWINASLREMHFKYLCNHSRNTETATYFDKRSMDECKNLRGFVCTLLSKNWRSQVPILLLWNLTKEENVCLFTMTVSFDVAAPKMPIAPFFRAKRKQTSANNPNGICRKLKWAHNLFIRSLNFIHLNE